MEKRIRCNAIAREAGRATGATRHERRLGSRALLGRPRSRAIGDGQSGSEPSRARLGIGSDRAAAREPSNQDRCERAPARELWMRCDRAPARERQKRCDRAPAREHRGQQPIRGQPGKFATERQRGSSRAYGPSPAPSALTTGLFAFRGSVQLQARTARAVQLHARAACTARLCTLLHTGDDLTCAR